VTRKVLMADQVEVVVSGLFKTHHYLQTTTATLGELTLPAFSTDGVFRADDDGRTLVVSRTSWWKGWHELRENGIVVGQARSQGFWRRTMSVGFRGAMYELVPAGVWSRGWYLVDDAETILLEIQPRGVFSRGAYLTAMVTMDVDLLLFVYYLVNVRWQEQAAATGVAASGS
jgi:hypothetical protein